MVISHNVLPTCIVISYNVLPTCMEINQTVSPTCMVKVFFESSEAICISRGSWSSSIGSLDIWMYRSFSTASLALEINSRINTWNIEQLWYMPMLKLELHSSDADKGWDFYISNCTITVHGHVICTSNQPALYLSCCNFQTAYFQETQIIQWFSPLFRYIKSLQQCLTTFLSLQGIHACLLDLKNINMKDFLQRTRLH